MAAKLSLSTIPTMILRTPNSLSSLSLFRLTTKPLSPQTLHFRHHNNLSVATSETAIESPTSSTHDLNQQHQHQHPWPEWVSLVDHLKSQGYFSKTSSQLEYREMNVLKDPCLSFARDRYDIFSSMPKGDIQIIVEGGCPKVLRKVVNSAKRLRLYVGLNEQHVCSICSLEVSCDRANVMLKESDEDARTVDLMRILMFYALDPSLISGAVRPPAIDQAESSARRLLSMFVDLSEASPGQACVESPKETSNKKQFVYRLDAVLPQERDLQQEKGTSNNQDTRRKAGPADFEVNEGDWICTKCSFMNFKRNVRCLKCKADAHKQGSAQDITMKRGDWNCLRCGCMNFASRKDCFRCSDPRPARALQPGEWECPKCDFLNFRRNIACYKCDTERTKETATQYEKQFWRRPQ